MPNLGLNQSDFKILEIPITIEKFELVSRYFVFGYISIGVTNQYSLFKVVPLNNISNR